MRRVFCALIMAGALTYLLIGNAQAADAVKKEKAPVSAEQKKLTKGEMIKSLKEMLEDNPDMPSSIPGLTVKEVEGKKIYEYNGKNIDELDNDTTLKIFSAGNRFTALKNSQRLQQQLKTVQQANDMSRLQGTLRPTSPPKTPATYNPPRTYNIPRTYAPPRTYKAPGR